LFHLEFDITFNYTTV